MFYAVFLLFVYDELKLSPELAGIILSVGAVGFVVGAVTAPSILKRIGLGGSLLVALLINGLGRLTIPTSIYGPAPVLLSAFWLLANIGIPIYNINQVSFRQAIIADELQGRMNATMRTFGYGAATAGALMGGIMGSAYGIFPVMTTGAIIALLPVIPIRFGTFGRLNDIRQTGPK
jgi:predicted MFS family arabinose efflux permease